MSAYSKKIDTLGKFFTIAKKRIFGDNNFLNNERGFMKKILFLSIALICGCSSMPKKVVLDTSSPNKPNWVDDNRMSWNEDKRIHFKGNYTIRGNERANACIDLAKLNIKESLITEIQEELKGAVDNASDSIREDAEIILNKSRTAQYRGSISGLRFTSSYWEKYALATDEHKISCHVIGSVSEADYRKTKRNVLNKITRANPELKKAIAKKQIDFFKKDDGGSRQGASVEEGESQP